MSALRVVIVGGGFGGLFATRALARAAVNVVLIDQRNYHLFRPMLYQVATGLLSADQISAPLRSIVSRQRNVEVLQDEVTAIDSAQRLVHLRQYQLPYDSSSSLPGFNTTTSDMMIGGGSHQGSNH